MKNRAGRKKKLKINLPELIFNQVENELIRLRKIKGRIDTYSYKLGNIFFNVSCASKYHWDKNFWGLNLSKVDLKLDLEIKHHIDVLDSEEIPNLIIKVWGSNQYAPTGVVKKRSNNQVQIIRDIHTDSWILNNIKTGKLVVIFDSLNKLPDWYKASPLRLPLAIISNLNNMNLIHGGAIEKNNKCKLFLGDGGSGKSTRIVKTLLKADSKLIADDYFVYDYLNNYIYPLYCSIKLREDNFLKFKQDFEIAEVGLNVATKKRIFNTQKLNIPLSNGGFIDEILLPSSSKFHTDELTTKDVFRAVIPSTMTGLLNKFSFTAKSFSNLAHFKNKSWINWSENG
ncbi:MAG: hypothetical protein RLZZ37_509 [Actinomycetota bacterium]|jgi:hypothetical protein